MVVALNGSRTSTACAPFESASREQRDMPRQMARHGQSGKQENRGRIAAQTQTELLSWGAEGTEVAGGTGGSGGTGWHSAEHNAATSVPVERHLTGVVCASFVRRQGGWKPQAGRLEGSAQNMCSGPLAEQLTLGGWTMHGLASPQICTAQPARIRSGLSARACHSSSGGAPNLPQMSPGGTKPAHAPARSSPA